MATTTRVSCGRPSMSKLCTIDLSGGVPALPLGLWRTVARRYGLRGGPGSDVSITIGCERTGAMQAHVAAAARGAAPQGPAIVARGGVGCLAGFWPHFLSI